MRVGIRRRPAAAIASCRRVIFMMPSFRMPDFERIERGSFHGGAGSRFAGPDFELTDGLFDKHFQAGNDLFALFARAADQSGLERVINHVENDFAGNVPIEVAVVHVGPHADRSGVDHDVEMAGERLLTGHGFTADEAGEGAHAIGITSGKCDLRAGDGEGAGSGPGRAAVADDETRKLSAVGSSWETGPETAAASVLLPRHLPALRQTVLTEPMRLEPGDRPDRDTG